MRIEEKIGLFLGNIQNIYKDPKISEFYKKNHIKKFASDIFNIKQESNRIFIIFPPESEKTIFDVLEENYEPSVIDRVEIKLSKKKKLTIYLENDYSGFTITGPNNHIYLDRTFICHKINFSKIYERSK